MRNTRRKSIWEVPSGAVIYASRIGDPFNSKGLVQRTCAPQCLQAGHMTGTSSEGVYRSAAAVVFGMVAGISGHILGLLGLLAEPAADLLAGVLGLVCSLLLVLLVLVALQNGYAHIRIE